MKDACRYITLIICFVAASVSAQEYNGLTGLLQVPTAETDSAGTFRGNMMFLHQEFIPEQLPDKNTFNYIIGITGFRWLELSYGATLLWMHKDKRKPEKKGFYNEDRRVNVKLTPLYEGRYWPAIAVGMDDIGRLERFKSGVNGNNYYQNIYVAASKHFGIHGHNIGAHVAYRYYSSTVNADRRGVAGGLTYTPYLGEKLSATRAWLQRPRMIVEWDGAGANVGADVLLWRHLFVQASLVHGQGFTGGLGYHYTIGF